MCFLLCPSNTLVFKLLIIDGLEEKCLLTDKILIYID